MDTETNEPKSSWKTFAADLRELVRLEIELAKSELASKGKHVALGIGLLIAAALGRPVDIGGLRLSARASIGAAHSPDFADADALVAAADAVMYRTKTERRAAART